MLDEDGYYLPVLPDEKGMFHSTVIPHFWLKAEWFWQRPLPNQELALAEILLTVPDLDPQLKIAYQIIFDTFSPKL